MKGGLASPNRSTPKIVETSKDRNPTTDKKLSAIASFSEVLTGDTVFGNFTEICSFSFPKVKTDNLYIRVQLEPFHNGSKLKPISIVYKPF